MSVPRVSVSLYGLDHVMLLVEHECGVVYGNQVGGVVCAQMEMNGILCPLELTAAEMRCIAELPYDQGREGITEEIANAIDSILSSKPATRFVKVDRSRLDDDWEAWVHVLVSLPDEEVNHSELDAEPKTLSTYSGYLRGFGETKGVLTWRNSD